MKKRILFIYNPVSGVLKKANLPVLIRKHINHNRFELHIKESEYAGHAIKLAKEAAQSGFDVVVAVGGDGSINEVLNGIVGTETVLGIIPMGSGNGLANHLGIPVRKVKKAIQVINRMNVEKLDIVKSNLHYFISVGGFGFEAAAAQRFKEQPLRGFVSYTLAIIRQYFFYNNIEHVKIELDKQCMERDVFIFTAFNSNQYGYNIGFTNYSSLKDGILEVVLVKAFKPIRLLWNIFILISRKPHWSSDVEYYKTKKVKISGLRNTYIQCDGDPFPWNDDLEMEVVEKAVNVIVPNRLKNF